LFALGYLTTLNVLNPDAFIARQNLSRYEAAGKIDAAYLTTLSADAVPVLVEVLAAVRGDSQLVLIPACANQVWLTDEPECQATPTEILAADLARRRAELGEATSWRRWQSWHLARWRAYELLSNP
jgi:hypothetical protein